ncbi:MAG: helix-turn-helix transcriptional regulator, partial [Firmicutes bacterium]|nr:helix-turn-helix transcriptional regulator [Bacillota bacterium]
MTLEEIRKKKRILGYTNATLSDLTGIPLGTLNKIMSGDTKNPRPENVKALEDVLFGSGIFYSISDKEHTVLKETTSMYGAEEKDEPREKRPGDYTIEDYYALPDDQRVEL